MPSYLLVSFNDRGLNYWDNFKIMSETRNVNQFMEDIFALKFDGGDDPKERLMQASGSDFKFQRHLVLYGSHWQGLLGAINKSPEKSLICVFTDNGSKDLELSRDILKKKRDKQLTGWEHQSSWNDLKSDSNHLSVVSSVCIHLGAILK